MSGDPTVALGPNRYGKSRVSLVKVTRTGAGDHVRDLDVSVALTGDLTDVHTRGVNAGLLPTDSQKNAVYALARQYGVDPIEEFGLRLARHFVDSGAAVDTATVHLTERPWQPIPVAGAPHPHAFHRGLAEQRTTSVRGTATGATLVSGIAGLAALKTAGSGFSGFHVDAYTTLAETDDRILATTITAQWRYVDPNGTDWDHRHATARRLLLEAFADTDSASLQHTLYAMGSRLLREQPELAEVRLVLPNRHHLEVDLSPFGWDNQGEVYCAQPQPYGLIEGVVHRADAPPPGSDDWHLWANHPDRDGSG